MEKDCYQLEGKINQYDSEEKKLEYQERVLIEKAKEAMKKKNMKDVKKYTDEAAHIRKKLEVLYKFNFSI